MSQRVSQRGRFTLTHFESLGSHWGRFTLSHFESLGTFHFDSFSFGLQM